jgi:hypothetical protein
MNYRKIISFALVTTVALGTIAFAKQNIKFDTVKYKVSKTSAEAKRSKYAEERVDFMLNDAWNDIKKTHNLRDEELVQEYYPLQEKDFNEFRKGNIAGFSDIEVCNEIVDVVNGTLHDLEKYPIGSTMPVIRLKCDMKVILIGFKSEDGRNHLITSMKNAETNKWDQKEQVKQGKEQIDIEKLTPNDMGINE